MRLVCRILWIAGAVGLVLLGLEARAWAEGPGEPLSNGAVEFFESHIRPVLVAKCYECHSKDSQSLKGGLRLDSAKALLRGGETGPVVVPHKPEESVLLSALKYDSYEMPPGGKLPDEVVADFDRWIAMGAPDPRSDAADGGSGSEAKNAEKRWAFRRPVRLELPYVANES